MGVDAEIACMEDVTDDEIDRANRFIKDRGWPLLWGYGGKDESEPVVTRRYGVVDFNCGGARYYGPGYERGEWHYLASGIMLALGALPGHEIRYGGDSSDTEDHAIITPGFLDDMWDYYLFSPDALAYRERRY